MHPKQDDVIRAAVPGKLWQHECRHRHLTAYRISPLVKHCMCLDCGKIGTFPQYLVTGLGRLLENAFAVYFGEHNRYKAHQLLSQKTQPLPEVPAPPAEPAPLDSLGNSRYHPADAINMKRAAEGGIWIARMPDASDAWDAAPSPAAGLEQREIPANNPR